MSVAGRNVWGKDEESVDVNCLVRVEERKGWYAILKDWSTTARVAIVNCLILPRKEDRTKN